MPGVLIVEDDKELREMLKMSLLRRNFTVFEAENGKAAITHFKPLITDLVVTDLIMPEEDGLKVVIKLRELKPSIKIIAILQFRIMELDLNRKSLTINNENILGGGKVGPGSYLNLAKALGADAIYSKPFSINDLITKIEQLLEYEQPV